VYIPWPPQGITAAIALFAICQWLGAGVLFTLLALIWAIASPRWVASLLEIRARRLTAITGYFMLSNGVCFIGLAISGGPMATLVLGTSSVGIGTYLLFASRS